MTQQFGGYPGPGQPAQPGPIGGYPPAHQAGAPSAMSMPQILAGVSGLLGLAAFAFGFMAFYGSPVGSDSLSGYNAGSSAGGAIALAVLAGLVGAAALWTGTGREFGLAAAAAALLTCMGMAFSPGDGVEVRAGAWLLLVIAVLIAAVQGVAMLEARGAISLGGGPTTGRPAAAYPPAQNPPPYAPPAHNPPPYAPPAQNPPPYAPPGYPPAP